MALMQGIPDISSNYFQVLHKSLLFWLDEGFLENGFYRHVPSGCYDGGTDLSMLVQNSENTSQFDFPLRNIVWQSSVVAGTTTISRPYTYYISEEDGTSRTAYNTSLPALTDLFFVDYHNGLLLCNPSSTYFGDVYDYFESNFGEGFHIQTDYYAKEIDVVYDQKRVAPMLEYVEANWDANLDMARFGRKLPILTASVRRCSSRPYEQGGTQYIDVDYSLTVMTQDIAKLSFISYLFYANKNKTIPTRKYGALYDSNPKLLYDSSYAYMAAFSSWNAVQITQFEEVRGERNGLHVAEYDLGLRITGL